MKLFCFKKIYLKKKKRKNNKCVCIEKHLLMLPDMRGIVLGC